MWDSRMRRTAVIGTARTMPVTPQMALRSYNGHATVMQRSCNGHVTPQMDLRSRELSL